MKPLDAIAVRLHNLHLKRAFPYVSSGLTFRQAWPAIDKVTGWLASPQQERWLFETVQRLPRRATIVEIGSFLGRSTISMALACLGTGRRVFAVDTFAGNAGDFVQGKNEVAWEGDSYFDRFAANLAANRVEGYVVPLVGLSQEIARLWRAPIDMLFVDGSHDYADVVADWKAFAPYVVAGGVVAFHDVTPEWDGPYRAWHEQIKSTLSRTGSVHSLAYGVRP